MLSPGESDIDDHDLCDIPPNFIAEAADLSHHCSPLLSFEDILAQEELLLSFDGLDDITPSIGKSSTAATPCHRVYTPASSPSPLLSNSDQEQWLNKRPSPHIPAKQQIWADIERQDSLVKWKKTIPPRFTSSPQKTTRSMKTKRLRLSDKKDLIPSKINIVT